MTDLLAILLGARALACVGTVGDDQLMDQVFVVFTTEHSFGHIELRCCLALFIQEFELH
ncbi:hypothetical protein D3C86_1707030 [compost metagenome]